MSKPKMRLRFPTYPDLTIQQGGYLPADNRAFACWYFYTLAQQLWEKLGDSTEDQFGLLDTDLWMDPQYERIARSVALIYGFDNPGVFLENRFWEQVEKQAHLMGYPSPKEIYKRPLRLIGLH